MSSRTRFQTLAATTALATLVLIAIGAIVRTTGSGLGCPDWPLCHGSWHPPLAKAPIIEYSHRTAATIVGLLVVSTAVVAFRRHRDDRMLTVLMALALPLLAFQAWLGEVTVKRELPPEVVMIHVSTAMLLFAVLSSIAVFAFLGSDRVRIRTPERRTVLLVTAVGAAVAFLVLLSGAYVVGSNASIACTTWPGCREAPLPFLDGGRAQDIHWLHRFAVVGGALVVATVATFVLRARETGPTFRRAAWGLVGLYGLQVLVGAGNVWTRLSDATRVAHLAIAAAIWALLVVMAVAGRYRPGASTTTPQAVVDPGTAHPEHPERPEASPRTHARA